MFAMFSLAYFNKSFRPGLAEGRYYSEPFNPSQAGKGHPNVG